MKIKGLISFSTDKGQDLKVENTTTKLGDMYFNAQAKRWFAVQRGIEEGVDFIKSTLLSMNGTAATLAGVNDNICVYLLNLTPEEITALNVESQLLPIYTPGTFEIDHSKILGWASIDRVSTQAKQGIFTSRSGDTILDDQISSLAWNWEAGKAAGSFNVIAIGLNVVNTGSSKYNGVAIYRGLERNDYMAGQALPSGYMARNNITGITGANEILLGDALTPKKARVKFDLVAKTRTELKVGDPAYDFPLSRADWPQLIVGDKLYYYIDNNNYLQVYNMTSGVHAQTSVSNGGARNILFTYNNCLYVWGDNYTLNAYNLGTLVAESAQNIKMADIKFPTDFKTINNMTHQYGISNYNDGTSIIFTVIDNSIVNQRAIVMSDPKTNSVIKICHRLNSVVNYKINNETVYFDYNVTDEIFKLLNKLTATDYNSFGTHGVKYSKWTGNMLSFRVFDAPQTIAADEVARVEYAYKYGV